VWDDRESAERRECEYAKERVQTAKGTTAKRRIVLEEKAKAVERATKRGRSVFWHRIVGRVWAAGLDEAIAKANWRYGVGRRVSSEASFELVLEEMAEIERRRVRDAVNAMLKAAHTGAPLTASPKSP
jgi:hypothetical protein